MGQIAGVQPGETIEVEISDLTAQGDGVGRKDGAVVFVAGGVPGDRVRARVLRVRRRHAQAVVESTLTPAPDRVEAVCAHQPVCGGCPLMVLAPEAALRVKVGHLEQTLRRVGGLEHSVARAVPSPLPLEYRNRVAFAVTRREGRDRIAFRARLDPAEHVPISRCHLVPEKVSAAAQELLEGLAARTRRGGRDPRPLRLELRGSLSRDEWMAVLHTTTGRWPGAVLVAEGWLASAPWRVGVVRIEQDRRGQIVGERCLAGVDVVHERLGDVEAPLSATSFLQVNPGVAERLYEVVAGMLHRGSAPGRVLDLYCGAGLVGALSVPDADELVGVEIHAPSLHRARELDGGRPRREWIQADATEAAERLAADGRRFDAVVVNPPRAGAGPGLPGALAALEPSRVVVISCHPAALARDLARLSEAGFAVVEVVALDMFPQTPHLEAVVELVPRERPG
jgi:23S rRNA (uracil1939-C5)-methyltransferase